MIRGLLLLLVAGTVPGPEAGPFDALMRIVGRPAAAVDGELAVGQKAVRLGDEGFLLEAPVLPSIFEEQRALLVLDASGRVSAVHLQFLPEPGSRATEVLRLYADVRAALTRALGRPAWERAEGTVRGPDALLRLSDGTAIRYLQWEGSPTVRAGFPRRIDGEVLVEVVILAGPLPRREERWGTRLF